MNIVFSPKALTELASYQSQPKLIFKVLELIEDIKKHFFTGKGKPEPLKGNLKGYWSRRITDEHRLVYYIEANDIQIVSCKYHYDD